MLKMPIVVQLAIDINNNAKSDHLKVDLPEGDDAGASGGKRFAKVCNGFQRVIYPQWLLRLEESLVKKS